MLFSSEYLQRKALNFLIHGEKSCNYVCRLCCCDGFENFFHGKDLLTISSEYFHGVLSVDHLLNEISDQNMNSDYVPNWYCKNCTNQLMLSFLFKKRCEEADKSWTYIIALLNDNIITARSQFEAVKSEVNELYINIVSTVSETTANSTFIKCKCCSLDIGECTKEIETPSRPPLKCKMCSALFKHARDYVHHVKNECKFIVLKPECLKCKCRFKTKELLNEHYKNICLKDNPEFIEKYLNNNDHLDIKPSDIVECFICKKVFKFRDSLIKHLRTKCLKEDPEELKKVLMRCCGVNTTPLSTTFELYKCRICSKYLFTKDGFDKHKLICYKGKNKSNKTYQCDYCQRILYERTTIITHLRTVHGDFKFACQTCGKMFKSRTGVNNHNIVHTRERNHECDLCHKKFVSKAALIHHRRLHTGEKPHKCSMCDEHFISISRKMEHTRRKHYAPSKECKICQKMFTTKSSLLKHLRGHFNPKSRLTKVSIQTDVEDLTMDQLISALIQS